MFNPHIFAFSSMFLPVFLLIVGIIVFRVVRGITQWSYNNKQPVLTVDAVVASKRTEVHNHMNGNTMHSSTTYYSTFEVESGDRMELRLSGNEYGQLAEGDYGKLTFQGSRYLGFERRV